MFEPTYHSLKSALGGLGRRLDLLHQLGLSRGKSLLQIRQFIVGQFAERRGALNMKFAWAQRCNHAEIMMRPLVPNLLNRGSTMHDEIIGERL